MGRRMGVSWGRAFESRVSSRASGDVQRADQCTVHSFSQEETSLAFIKVPKTSKRLKSTELVQSSHSKQGNARPHLEGKTSSQGFTDN